MTSSDTKICSHCKIEKPLECFSKHKTTKDGWTYQCKECQKMYRLTHRDEIRERAREYRDKSRAQAKEWRENNKERIRASHKKWYEENKERISEKNRQRGKEWRARNKDKQREYNREYRIKNRWKRREYSASNRRSLNASEYRYLKKRAQRDPLFRATKLLRGVMRRAFKRGNFKKSSSSFDLLGCSAADLLEKWKVSEIPAGYHVDHIVPLAQAETVEEAEKLCHHTNLQLLTAKENQEKSDKPTEKGLILCRELLGREWID